MSKLHIKQAGFFISLIAILVILAGLSPKGASAFAPAGFTETPTNPVVPPDSTPSPTSPVVPPDSTPSPTVTNTSPPREHKPKATATGVLLPVTGEVPPAGPWAFFGSSGPVILLTAVLIGILIGFALSAGPRKWLFKKLGFLSPRE